VSFLRSILLLLRQLLRMPAPLPLRRGHQRKSCLPTIGSDAQELRVASQIVIITIKRRTVMPRLLLTIDLPDTTVRPGIPMAQMLREIEPVIELANPLVDGKLLDRLTGEPRAEWTVASIQNRGT
jgi:hypothetical protein